MQQILIPDYLDGSAKTNRVDIQGLSVIASLYEAITEVSDTQLNINNLKLKEISEKIGIDLFPYINILEKDSSVKTFLRAYKGYRENNGGNYIFSKDLTKALKYTKLDIKLKLLPKKFNGFLHLPNIKDYDGDTVKGVFVHISDRFTPSIFLGVLVENKYTRKLSVSHLNIPLNEKDNTIENIIKKYKHVSLIPSEGMSPDNPIFIKVEEQGKYTSHFKTIFNAIIYIHNSEKLVERLNEFSPKKSKRLTQKKIYTEKPFYLIGEDFNLPKVYTTSEIKVRGHFRWQPYGANRLKRKLIYIEPYKKELNLTHHSDIHYLHTNPDKSLKLPAQTF